MSEQAGASQGGIRFPTIPEEQRQQVVGYLKHQASKGTEGLLALIDRTAGRLDGALEGVTDEQSRFRPSPDGWSIRDVLLHVEASLRHHAGLARALAHGGDPGRFEADPAALDTGHETLSELRRRIADGYEEARAAVQGLGPDANLAATAWHPVFGDLNCQEWAAFIYVHCGSDHVNQIEQIKGSAGFPAA